MKRQVNFDDLGTPDLKVAQLQVWLHGRQFPDAADYDDGNWLRVTVHCGGAGASVWASGAILLVQELADWGELCDALYQGKRDEAELAPIEPELRVLIRRSDQLGHFTMHVDITPDHLTQSHSFAFEIDQSYLPEITRQCRTIRTRFPIRGAEDHHAV